VPFGLDDYRRMHFDRTGQGQVNDSQLKLMEAYNREKDRGGPFGLEDYHRMHFGRTVVCNPTVG
jgi:hypothetical protein